MTLLRDLKKNLNLWLAETHNLTLQMLFEKVLNESAMLHHILQQNDRQFQLEAITTLFDHIKATALSHPRLSIADYIDILGQMQVHDIKLEIHRSGAKKGGIQFITTHSSKGLEFEYVFLLGCTRNNWESARGDSRNFTMPDTFDIFQ